MSKILVAAGSIALCMSLFQCNNSNDSNNNPTAPKGILENSVAYSVSGNIFKTYIPAGTNNYCSNNTLVVSKADTSVVPFEISGNTLKTFNDPDTNKYSTYIDTTVIIQTYNTFTRKSGSGSSLQGTWIAASIGYSVLRGTITQDEKALLDLQNSSSQGFIGAEVEFTATTISIFAALPYAQLFIENWNTGIGYASSTDSALYAITVALSAANSVQMTGQKSGEVVTVSFANSGDATFSSSIQSHTVGIVYVNPASCPNTSPQWYSVFLTANQKSVSSVLNKSAFKEMGNSQVKHESFFKRIKTTAGYSLQP